MLGFSYMQVRGKEFPLWVVILIAVIGLIELVLVVWFVCKFLSDCSKEKKEKIKKDAEEKAKKSYMGEDRLLKILSHYILSRYGEEAHNSFASNLKECEQKRFYAMQQQRTGVFYIYENGYPGYNEWLKCICYCNGFGHDFVVEATGIKAKRVTITDYPPDESGNATIITHYDENFHPKPNETEFPAEAISLPFIKPFTGGKTTYKGIDRDACVCYDIAKDKQPNDR